MKYSFSNRRAKKDSETSHIESKVLQKMSFSLVRIDVHKEWDIEDDLGITVDWLKWGCYSIVLSYHS